MEGRAKVGRKGGKMNGRKEGRKEGRKTKGSVSSFLPASRSGESALHKTDTPLLRMAGAFDVT
jgi:hypothetical protein